METWADRDVCEKIMNSTTFMEDYKSLIMQKK